MGTGDHPSETWSTSGISEHPNRDFILDRPDGSLSLNSATSTWGVSSSNWSDNATESAGVEENGARARSGSGGSIDLDREEQPLQMNNLASREVQGQYSPIPSINALAGPENNEDFSLSATVPQPPQLPPQPHFVSSTEYHDSLSVHTSPRSSVFPSSPPHSIYNAFAQQSPPAVYSRPRAPPPPPVPIQDRPVELTPAIISKAQKHCRFAVSALNYEDAEQAKKELRAALALLGG
ncbi:hypothetical protein BYT27DRAFT_6591119 [Phlegmacium glaucopus]|nr:hypothetical protein BYT27DRAFT_6591119 [Phlegmacium glaucopus]